MDIDPQRLMAENTDSSTLKDYPDLIETIIDAVCWRMTHGAQFSEREIDHLNRDNRLIEEILDQLGAADYFKFLGLLRDHQEKLAVKLQELRRDGR